jgi:hypothetical protein
VTFIGVWGLGFWVLGVAPLLRLHDLFGVIILNNTFASGLLAYQETTKTTFFVPPKVLKSQI